MLSNISRLHFIGIGGSGMSAIAKVFLELGYVISGSDIARSEIVHKLEQLGAKVYIGHQSSNIEGAEAIVVSTAIPESNPELKAARDKGIKIFHRADLLATLMQKYHGIAIAGAHGKTTTTSMIALILENAGLEPTVLIGGELDYLGGNAKLGKGRFLVAEADESDGSFLKLSPKLTVITNIENDHMDFYKTMDNILSTFNRFLHNLPQDDGMAVLCFDNPHVRAIADKLQVKYSSYALNYPADFTAINIKNQGISTVFDVCQQGKVLGNVQINVPGRHNVANSLATIAVGLKIGLTFDQIAEGLTLFRGAKRRFQTKGRVNGIWVIDDYAHHPTEIRTTLLAARDTQPKRLICAFQPHRYSRTQLLRQEFGEAFKSADLLVLTDIYSAGEQPIPGITGEILKEEIECQTSQRITYIPDKNKIARYLAAIVEPGDLVMTMGAGDIYKSGEELVEILLKHNN